MKILQSVLIGCAVGCAAVIGLPWSFFGFTALTQKRHETGNGAGAMASMFAAIGFFSIAVIQILALIIILAVYCIAR